MLKILQARLQQYVNRELPDVQASFRKGRGTRDQIANIRWVIEKAREFQKNLYFCFIDFAKAFDCVDHNKLENSERDGNTRPSHLPLEKSMQVKKQQLELDMKQQTGSKLGKEYINAEYIMWNAELDEAQAGIKIAGRNINNLDMHMTLP